MSTPDRDVVALGIQGSGGGKGGGGGGIDEQATTARSQTRARVYEFISEGEVGGLVNGLQSVFLDGTPIENPDGTLNFQGRFAWRNGTQSQAPLPGQGGVANTTAPNVDVTYRAPHTFRITNPLVDSVRVTLEWPQGLIKTDSENQEIEKASVGVRISRQYNGGGFAPIMERQVSEKTEARYQRDYEIILDGPFPVDVQIARVDEDPQSTFVTNQFRVARYAEIISAKLRFPLTAVFGHDIVSTQFDSIPTRSYEYLGVICRVPTNYDPATKVYRTSGEGTTNGVWDGTFKRAFTDCPAWVLLELATNKIWGMGSYLSDRDINKWRLYRIGQYCDQKVPDGKGGVEARWSFYAYLTKQEAAFKVFDRICSAFRGFSVWAGNQILPVADMPEDPVYVYTAANVIGGEFTRQSGGLDTRFTRVICYYNDDKQQGRRVPVVIDDDEGIRKYGILVKQVEGHCRSPGVAMRIAKSYLITNQEQNESILWQVPTNGAYRQPGEVVQIFDPARAKQKTSGRVLQTRENGAIVLDRVFDFDNTLSYMLVGVAEERRFSIQVDNLSTTRLGDEERAVVELSQPLPEVEDPIDIVWAIVEKHDTQELVKIESVNREDPDEEDAIPLYTINAVPYIEDKFDRVDVAANRGLPVEQNPTGIPPKVENIYAVQREYSAGNGQTKLVAATFSWDGNPRTQKYAVTITSEKTPPETRVIYGPSVSFGNVTKDVYEITVVPITGELRGPASTKTIELNGQNAPITDLEASPTLARTGDIISFKPNDRFNGEFFDWQFGDFSEKSGEEVTHSYETEGVYTITLFSANENGRRTETKENYVTIDDNTQRVGFSTSEENEDHNRALFTAEHYSGAEVTEWEWDWGDSSENDTGQAVKHEYETGGEYYVTLYATSALGVVSVTQRVHFG